MGRNPDGSTRCQTESRLVLHSTVLLLLLSTAISSSFGVGIEATVVKLPDPADQRAVALRPAWSAACHSSTVKENVAWGARPGPSYTQTGLGVGDGNGNEEIGNDVSCDNNNANGYISDNGAGDSDSD